LRYAGDDIQHSQSLGNCLKVLAARQLSRSNMKKEQFAKKDVKAKSVSVKEATEKWVSQFNEIPQSLVRKAYSRKGISDIREVTPISSGNRVDIDHLYVERDNFRPIWGTMWMFDNVADNYWIEEKNGLQLMADCGFRIYEIEEGYIFGIDGAGYAFYEAHWIPLYRARGLKWHDSEDA